MDDALRQVVEVGLRLLPVAVEKAAGQRPAGRICDPLEVWGQLAGSLEVPHERPLGDRMIEAG